MFKNKFLSLDFPASPLQSCDLMKKRIAERFVESKATWPKFQKYSKNGDFCSEHP